MNKFEIILVKFDKNRMKRNLLKILWGVIMIWNNFIKNYLFKHFKTQIYNFVWDSNSQNSTASSQYIEFLE